MTEIKKSNKSTVIIVVVLFVLTIAVVVLAMLRREDIQERIAVQESGTFLLTANDYTHRISMDDLFAIGYEAVTSSPRGETRNFTGVPLGAIFDHFNIDYSAASNILFTSLDGFATAISVSDALDRENTFIVFEEDGVPLGTREEGGRGPYMVVVALDPFPNRWARYLMEVVVQ